MPDMAANLIDFSRACIPADPAARCLEFHVIPARERGIDHDPRRSHRRRLPAFRAADRHQNGARPLVPRRFCSRVGCLRAPGGLHLYFVHWFLSANDGATAGYRYHCRRRTALRGNRRDSRLVRKPERAHATSSSHPPAHSSPLTKSRDNQDGVAPRRRLCERTRKPSCFNSARRDWQENSTAR